MNTEKIKAISQMIRGWNASDPLSIAVFREAIDALCEPVKDPCADVSPPVAEQDAAHKAASDFIEDYMNDITCFSEQDLAARFRSFAAEQPNGLQEKLDNSERERNNSRTTFTLCHSLLDGCKAGYFQDGVTHPQLLERIRLVLRERDQLRQETNNLTDRLTLAKGRLIGLQVICDQLRQQLTEAQKQVADLLHRVNQYEEAQKPMDRFDLPKKCVCAFGDFHAPKGRPELARCWVCGGEPDGTKTMHLTYHDLSKAQPPPAVDGSDKEAAKAYAKENWAVGGSYKDGAGNGFLSGCQHVRKSIPAMLKEERDKAEIALLVLIRSCLMEFPGETKSYYQICEMLRKRLAAETTKEST